MTARKKKSPVSVYLDPEIMKMLVEFAARRGQSRSMIAEAAIASFLSPDADERREAAIIKRLDQIDRRVSRLERDVGDIGRNAGCLRALLAHQHASAARACGAGGAREGDRTL